MRWSRDADVVFEKQEPVLIERSGVPATAAPPATATATAVEQPVALDEQQRAIVAAQWALVERALRRDLPQHGADRQALQAAVPEAPRPQDPAEAPAAQAPARVIAAMAPTPGPIGRSVDVAETPSRPPPKVRSRWFGEPSVAERKRIVKPKRFAASASGTAQRQRAMLLSVVAIACASAAVAFWQLDRRFDGRMTVVQPASPTQAGSAAPSAAPTRAPTTPSAATVQPARKTATARPAAPVPSAATTEPAAGAEADSQPARTASEPPAAGRREESAPGRAWAVAPVRAPSAQREGATAGSTRSAWQREERFRDANANARAPITRAWDAPSPLPEAEPTAQVPSPAPLPYHPVTSPAWRSRAGAPVAMPGESAAPLPYGGPEVGSVPAGR